MELSEILDSLSGSNMEKTASHTESSNSTLSSAIDRALGTADSFEKTASYSNPSNDLIKIAQDISNAETDALVKEAHIYGRAVADGFAARMSQYSGSNTGYYGSGHSADTVKEAMELGYIHASNALSGAGHSGYSTKTASDNYTVKVAYAQGQEDAVKTASFLQGQEDAVKVASFLQGQEDAVRVVGTLTKIAHDYSNFGFKVGNSVLKRLGR